MRWKTCTNGWTVLALSASVLFAPTALGVNYVVDGLNGDDANSGISATGGASDLAGLDFSDAFKTIGQATSLTAPGDFIFVNAGAYPEQVRPTTKTTLIAVGEAVLGNADSVAVVIAAPAFDVVLDGFRIENASTGVVILNSVTGIQLTNLTIRSCNTAMDIRIADATVRRCEITDCEFGLKHAGGPLTVEQCTFVGNVLAVALLPAVIFRNNVIAFNGTGISAPARANLAFSIDFNDLFGNIFDYVSGIVPGPNDISVDPQFIDVARRILTLRPTSPLINAGEGIGGGPPLTMGARECGFASSNASDGWADWIDENGVLITSGLSTLVEIDAGTGQIILKPSVSRASVRSPVFAKGPLKTLQFAALEDLTPPSGSRSVIDQDDFTFQRALRFRASATAFGATDFAPAFETVFEHQELFLATNRRFVQVELTLTNGGL